MVNEADPSLVLEPVVHVHAERLDLSPISFTVPPALVGGFLGALLTVAGFALAGYDWDLDNKFRMGLMVGLLALVAASAARIARWLFRYSQDLYYQKLRPRLTSSTLGSKARLLRINGQMLKRPRPFDVDLWDGPPLVCAMYEPGNDVLEIQATEEAEIFSGSRRFESAQPFPWGSLIIPVLLGVSFMPAAYYFWELVIGRVFVSLIVLVEAILIVMWASRAATIHAILPISFSSCIVTIGSVQITRFGRTSSFKREDSVMFIEPQVVVPSAPLPKRVLIKIELVRRDGHVRRMVFRGAANPCIADLIGRWMYGYEIPDNLAKRANPETRHGDLPA